MAGLEQRSKLITPHRFPRPRWTYFRYGFLCGSSHVCVKWQSLPRLAGRAPKCGDYRKGGLWEPEGEAFLISLYELYKWVIPWCFTHAYVVHR
jgi:hypothetical protein